jgi:hypothetical protein
MDVIGHETKAMDTIPVPFHPFLHKKIKSKTILIPEKDFLAGIAPQYHMIDCPWIM